MDIVIHGQLTIKARIQCKTGKSYIMNSQLVQQLRKERYATGVNITSEPLNVQEVGFVVEGLSAERMAQASSEKLIASSQVTKPAPDTLRLTETCRIILQFFFTESSWSRTMDRSYNADEPLVGLSLTDVSMANFISADNYIDYFG